MPRHPNRSGCLSALAPARSHDLNREHHSPSIPSTVSFPILGASSLTSKRIDFLLSGTDDIDHKRAVIVELKQWESVEGTPIDGLVRTFLGGALRGTHHPGYQAWSYAELLRGFNEEAYDRIDLHPCALLIS